MFNIDKLHPKNKEFLIKMNKRHQARLGLEERQKYTLDKIKKVTVHKDHMKVYYEKDWYHYHVNSTWY